MPPIHHTRATIRAKRAEAAQWANTASSCATATMAASLATIGAVLATLAGAPTTPGASIALAAAALATYCLIKRRTALIHAHRATNAADTLEWIATTWPSMKENPHG